MIARTLAAALGALAISLSAAAPAFELDRPLEDPALEARAQTIDESLRCLVCQNQSIAESNADLARDLRAVVRERLAAGESDAAVVAYMVSRYGDFVLLKPPLKSSTYGLWFGPAAALLAGAGGLYFYLRRRQREAAREQEQERESAVREWSADERRRLERLMREGDPS